MLTSDRLRRAAEIREDVFHDPDLTDQLRLFTLATVHLWETKPERKRVKTFKREHWSYHALRLMGRVGTVEELTPYLRWLIHGDVPRYRLDPHANPFCLGTMLRPAGAACQRRTTMRTTMPNPLTGELTLVGSCRDKRHEAQAREKIDANRQAWHVNGEPSPKPNSGGVLLRYFTTGIEPLYAWADKRYTAGDHVPEPPRGALALVTNLADRRPT